MGSSATPTECWRWPPNHCSSPRPADRAGTRRMAGRNSQRAVRSAKETILEVIGKPLDDQLRIEGWNSYTCVDRDEAAALLGRFYHKTAPGRAADHATPIHSHQRPATPGRSTSNLLGAS